MNRFVLAGCVMMGAAALCADDAKPDDAADGAKAAEAEAAEEETEPAKAVRHVKKQPEYKTVAAAVPVAQDWNCPIVVLVRLQDEPTGPRVYSAYFTKDYIKKFVKQNCVFAYVQVPKFENPEKKNSRRRNAREKTPPKPDYTKISGMDAAYIKGGLGMLSSKNPVRNPKLPQILVLSADGKQCLGRSIYSAEVSGTDLSVSSFDSLMRDAFKAGKYEYAPPAALTKLVEKEKKAQAKASK